MLNTSSSIEEEISNNGAPLQILNSDIDAPSSLPPQVKEIGNINSSSTFPIPILAESCNNINDESFLENTEEIFGRVNNGESSMDLCLEKEEDCNIINNDNAVRRAAQLKEQQGHGPSLFEVYTYGWSKKSIFEEGSKTGRVHKDVGEKMWLFEEENGRPMNKQDLTATFVDVGGSSKGRIFGITNVAKSRISYVSNFTAATEEISTACSAEQARNEADLQKRIQEEVQQQTALIEQRYKAENEQMQLKFEQMQSQLQLQSQLMALQLQSQLVAFFMSSIQPTPNQVLTQSQPSFLQMLGQIPNHVPHTSFQASMSAFLRTVVLNNSGCYVPVSAPSSSNPSSEAGPSNRINLNL